MIRLEMKNCHMILTEKQQKYQLCHQVKLINMNILQEKKILTYDQNRMIEQAKFIYSLLKKALEKQAKVIEDQGEQ